MTSRIKAHETEIAELKKEAAKFECFKSAAGQARYHQTMMRICELQCGVNNLKCRDESLDAELVKALGEEKARAAKSNNQVAAAKKLLVAQAAGKISAEEVAYLVEMGSAASVDDKELE